MATNITHIKEQESGYRVTWANGTVSSVPPGHRFNQDIQDAINEGVTVEPIETDAEKKRRLTSYANSKRDRVEQGTFTYNGWQFDADSTSVARISGASRKASRAISNGTTFTVDWTDANNTVRTLSETDLVAMDDELTNHAIVCHELAKQIKADIEAGTITSEDEIDNAAWPQ